MYPDISSGMNDLLCQLLEGLLEDGPQLGAVCGWPQLRKTSGLPKPASDNGLSIEE